VPTPSEPHQVPKTTKSPATKKRAASSQRAKLDASSVGMSTKGRRRRHLPAAAAAASAARPTSPLESHEPGLAADIPEAPRVLALFSRGHTKKDIARPTFSRTAVETSSVCSLGLIGSSEWHKENPHRIGDQRERGLLLQTTAAYVALESELPDLNVGTVRESGGFGENVLVSGLTVESAHIGDRFDVIAADGTSRGFGVVVTSPRRPCGSVDLSHGRRHSAAGMRAACAGTGYAGMFMRVVPERDADYPDDPYAVMGTIEVGDLLIRTAAPHPKWSVRRVAAALYKDFVVSVPYRYWWDEDKWAEVDVPLSDAELTELAAIKDLAEEEWRDQIKVIQKIRLKQGWGLGAILRKAAGFFW